MQITIMNSSFVIFRVYPLLRNLPSDLLLFVGSHRLAMNYSAFSVAAGECLNFHSEPLSSNGLFRLSGVMSQYVYHML
jgi:hypothetical protein